MMFKEIYKLLETEKICVLATCLKNKPHLSLMNFTYLPKENVIIMSSKPNTTKVGHIIKNPEVAVLLYDPGAGKQPPLSCTLHGKAAILNPGEDSLYREKHFKKHRNMGVFIEGKNIVAITVKIKSAVISDVLGKVKIWPAAGQK